MTPTGFVGVDPVGLHGLADTVDQYAQRVVLADRNLVPILGRYSVPGSDRIGSLLNPVAQGLAELADGLRWRGRVVEQAQLIGDVGVGPFPVGAMLAEFAASGAVVAADWREAFTSWRAGVVVDRLATMSPQQVAMVFAAMAPAEVETVARDHPELIGSLDGAPPSVRFLANDLLIEQEIRRLRGIVSKFAGTGAVLSEAGVIAALTALRIAELQKWLDQDRQVLLFDPRGDGRVAEVFGDLATARRVAVLVPGMANDMDNFSTDAGGFRSDALALHEAVADPNIATIAWLGYDTPDGIDAVARIAAESGAPDLRRFLVGLDPEAVRSIMVVAHSYGSVVAGLAAADGIAADDLVFVGSPGTSLATASEARLRPDGRVWAALATGDPIGLGVDPLESFRWWHGLHPILPLLGMCRTLTNRDELWHGTSPVADEFGARQITTTGSHGHSAYYEAATLRNLAMVLAGRYSEVSLVE